ncbi:MAG: phosphoglucomutase [Firmicutes bacterium HGW-Firmicutes-15]|nr:MAG: phosphoglucomutase [Firmicutes bacterium HGW-Firmicutes-15]
MSHIDNYLTWLNNSQIDEETKEELRQIQNNTGEIEERFYKDLEFGTGGFRGIIGAGTNRMNKYTVRRATQGLADYIASKGSEGKNRGVVIAYDSRRMSREFSEEAALVLGANAIKAYLFNDLRATPQLSFAIRYLNCIAGIVITASHNPAEYNGYKVYWEDGGQITTNLAQAITESIDKVNAYLDILLVNREDAINKGLLVYLDEAVDDKYIEEVKKQSLRGDVVKKVADEFKVVYTPLHGTGNVPVRRVLREIGFNNVFVVPEQELPDPEFSTVVYPNPEDKKAFELAIDLAKKIDAHLILGTDPDCDRVGAVVKDKTGEYIILTGNQTGALLVEYVLSSLKENKRLPENGVIVKTIVTSELGTRIAENYGINMVNVLTGFKYIGEKIKEFEETGDRQFILGYEESYGYLAGTYARDKDAVVASMLICEMAAYYYSKGMTLYEALLELYDRYGYFAEDLKSITVQGKEGLEKIYVIMEQFRNRPPMSIADNKVVCFEDYKSQQRVYMNHSKDVEKIELPKANVVKFILENDGWMCLRPSGTEPKLKIYGGIKGNSWQEVRGILIESINYMENLIKDL